MIKINNLCKSYDFEVLQNIDLELPDSGFVAIVGESGSGKSTLLKCIGLLENINSGDILYNGTSLNSLGALKKDKIRGRIFAYIPQMTNLIENESVDKGLSYFNQDAQKRKEVLELLGIADKADELARNLSGGERQRVAIAQALLRQAPVLLCDEITANLDPENAEEVHKILKEISKDRLVLCVGHNPKMLMEYADRIITLKEGQIQSDETLNKQTKDNQKSHTLEYAPKTSLGASKFFRIFSWGIKQKLARIIFCALFLFLSMSGLCLGITQPISGSDGLIRKQAELLGVDFVKVQERQEGSFYAVNSDHWQLCTIFVDFEKEKEHFELIDGNFPSKDNEVLVSEFMSKYGKLEVGDEISISYGADYIVTGIFKSDISAYKISSRDYSNAEYYPYPSISGYYMSINSLSYYEENLFRRTVYSKGYIIGNYYNEPIIAGRQIDENATDKELLVTSGYIRNYFECKIEDVRANPQLYFNNLQKNINLNGYDFTIVGMCDNEYSVGLCKIGPKLYLDDSIGYYMPIDEVEKDNFWYKDGNRTTFIGVAMQNDTNLTRIGIPIFIVFAVLAMIVVINLNIYEIDEKKVLFRNMRQAGFSKQSLATYNLFVNFFILAIAVVLFMIIGLPIISHYQIIDLEFDSMYLYVLNGWAVLLAILTMAIITIIAYLITYTKFNKEISVCSKLQE